MKRVYAKEFYRFDSFDEIKDAINNHELVKVEVLDKDGRLDDYDVITEKDEPISEDNPAFIRLPLDKLVNAQEIPLENFYMVRYL